MNGEEKIIKVMEQISQYNQSPMIKIGKYTDEGIECNNVVIPKDMLYWLDFLKERRAKKVSGQVEMGGAGDEAHTHGWTDTSEYIEPIKSGEYVAFYKLNDYKFLVIGRVVE